MPAALPAHVWKHGAGDHKQAEHVGRTVPVHGRPRSEASRGAIIAATNRLLRTIGPNRMSIEAVAEASGVGKTTIYRWWPNKGTLALDAYLEDMRATVVVPDTGGGGEDLRRHAQAVIGFHAGEEGRIFAQFMAKAQNDPRLGEAFRERFLAQRAVKTIWQRAWHGATSAMT